MTHHLHIYKTRFYEHVAPLIARLIFGAQFLLGAAFKIPGTAGFQMEVAQTAAAGWPLAEPSVIAAFILEVCCGIMLIVGYRARLAAFLLAIFTFILAFVFYRHVSDMMIMGMFVSHMAFIAGLLYVSVYGAKSFAIRTD